MIGAATDHRPSGAASHRSANYIDGVFGFDAKSVSMANDPLANTAHVVITGNPTDGWTLVNWNGRPVEFR